MEIACSLSNYLLIFSSLITAYILHKFLQSYRRMKIVRDSVNMFPMEKKHWLWGHVDQFPGTNDEGLKYFQDMTDKYHKAYGFWFLNWLKPSIHVCHPDTMKSILKTAEPKSSTSGTYRYGMKWIGNGLILSSGDKWFRNRKLLTPAFHFENLNKFIAVDNECVDIFLDKLSKYAESGESIEITNNVSALTLDIILRCVCSYDNNIQEIGEHHPYMDTVRQLEDLWMKRLLTPWQHFDFIYNLSSDSRNFTKLSKYINDISDELIQKRKEEHKLLDEKSADKNDILNVLLRARDEDGNGLSDEEVRSELNTLLFAGHDTTAVSISWALYNLAKHPECQKLCQEEVDDVFKGRTTDYVSHEDFPKLFYLTCCIKESMRLYSTVPALERELTKPLTIDGRECPAGSIINPIIYSLHRNEVVWPDREKFDPERFFPQNVEKQDPFAFVPFSAGPRNCIGQHFAMNEMKIIMSKILHRYTVSVVEDHKIRIKFGLVMKTENGIYLNVKKR